METFQVHILTRQIAVGVIIDTDVNAANKDGAVGTPSMRTLGSGAQQAMPGTERSDQFLFLLSRSTLKFQRLNNVLDLNSVQMAQIRSLC